MNVIIVGGGIIGTSTAYFLAKNKVSVTVLERDPTYTNASFGRSCGGFRHQFLQKENCVFCLHAIHIPVMIRKVFLNKVETNNSSFPSG